MKIQFRNADVHYEVSGSGDALILLHGFLESKEIWDDFVPEFSKYGRIIRIDLPGHGKSGCLAEIHSMELMAEAVHAVLDELGIQKGDFIGHSMGGYVALAFVEEYPKMVNDLMLLNSTPQADSEEKKAVREHSVEVVQKNKKAYISMAISNLLSAENSSKFGREVQKLKEEANKFPIEGIIAALKGMKIRTDRTETLKNFIGNKIIVVGKEDSLIDPNEMKKLAAQCGCRFFAFSGGHLGYLENKEEFRKLCISSKK